MSADVFTVFLNLPTTIKGYVKANMDNSYTIVLNSRLSAKCNLDTYIHELSHILNGDYDTGDNADAIESLRHASDNS